MVEQVPDFNNEAIAELILKNYGIAGKISPLVSFEDQNALIKTPGASYVLKIANKKWSDEFLQMQSEVLGYLKSTAPELTFPEIIKTLKGETIIHVDGFAVRLLTFLVGDVIANMTRSPELYEDIGRFMGQFSKAMQDYSPAMESGSDKFWKLDNVIACRPYLPDVIDEDTRDRIERLYEVYENNIFPRLPRLRKAVIHSDANEQNLLVSRDNLTKIVGLIDFGEIQFAPQINELAITLAYSLLGENDIAMASQKMREGDHREFKLKDEEQEIIYYLMAMRLVTSIIMTSHMAKKFPDNEYILISQKPARALLKQLEEEKYILE